MLNAKIVIAIARPGTKICQVAEYSVRS